MEIEPTSRLICDNESLSAALKAALKVSGKDKYDAVRFRRSEDDEYLIISSVNEKATFVTQIRADFIEWHPVRDDIIEVSSLAAKSLATFQVKVPKDADVEQAVSITFGEERIRLQDETGLWSTPGGRDEHRSGSINLGGDHVLSVERAANMEEAMLWCGPDQIKLLSAVVGALKRPLRVIVRGEPAPGISRWHFGGPNWWMTMASTSDRDPDVSGEDEETSTHVDESQPKLVVARPPRGMA